MFHENCMSLTSQVCGLDACHCQIISRLRRDVDDAMQAADDAALRHGNLVLIAPLLLLPFFWSPPIGPQ